MGNLRRLLAQRAAVVLLTAVTGSLAMAVPMFAPAQAAGDPQAEPPAQAPWRFAVSGDSRNCGDVVMPSIAAAVRAQHSVFYWHLGDLRALYAIDEDYQALHPQASMADYLAAAWPDFKDHQAGLFRPVPFFLGIGNHELVPPRSRADFVAEFGDWLDAEPIRNQRLRDDPTDRHARTYYHWKHDGVDFISLDNATPDQFDAMQMRWVNGVLARDVEDSGVRAIVLGMHETLPESLARGHSMSDVATAETSGLALYQRLLETRRSKPVYVLASHSHFVMEDVFDSAYWREHGGVLPGWIIGTAGAVRYPLPDDAGQARFAKTHVYGYLLATVSPAATDTHPSSAASAAADPIHFQFQEVSRADVPVDVERRFGPALIERCYVDNAK